MSGEIPSNNPWNTFEFPLFNDIYLSTTKKLWVRIDANFTGPALSATVMDFLTANSWQKESCQKRERFYLYHLAECVWYLCDPKRKFYSFLGIEPVNFITERRDKEPLTKS